MESQEKICVYCGSSFIASGRQLKGRVKVLCSNRCRQHSSTKRRHPERLNLKSKACLECGTVFETYRDYKKFCSSKCYHKLYRRSYQRIYRDRPGYILRARGHKLKAFFGLDLAKYENLLKEQGSVCKICGKSPEKRHLDVDHNHKTGEIRGLLCLSCNTKLGWFERNTVNILSYLRFQIEETK